MASTRNARPDDISHLMAHRNPLTAQTDGRVEYVRRILDETRKEHRIFQSHQTGDVLLEPPGLVGWLYAVLDGVIKLEVVQDSGRTFAVRHLCGGELFGIAEIGILGLPAVEFMYTAVTRSRSNGTILAISPRAVAGLTSSGPIAEALAGEAIRLYRHEFWLSAGRETINAWRAVAFALLSPRVGTPLTPASPHLFLGEQVFIRKLVTWEQIAAFTRTSDSTVRAALDIMRTSKTVETHGYRGAGTTIELLDVPRLVKATLTGSLRPYLLS
jgi:CRP-like cAMP-binding protein